MSDRFQVPTRRRPKDVQKYPANIMEALRAELTRQKEQRKSDTALAAVSSTNADVPRSDGSLLLHL